MVDIEDRRQLLSLERATDRLPQETPFAAGLVIEKNARPHN